VNNRAIFSKVGTAKEFFNEAAEFPKVAIAKKAFKDLIESVRVSLVPVKGLNMISAVMKQRTIIGFKEGGNVEMGEIAN